jgi:hypothetical protein
LLYDFVFYETTATEIAVTNTAGNKRLTRRSKKLVERKTIAIAF